MLVSEALDRTFDEWLYPAGIQRPAWDKLQAAITTAGQTTIHLTGRVSTVPAGAILELGSEAMLVDSVSGAAPDVTVVVQERGYLETDPVSSAPIGAKVFVNPTFLRKTAFNTLNSVLGLLYPWGIYSRKVDDTQTYTTQGMIPLPAGGKYALSVLFRTDTGANENWYHLSRGRGDYEQFTEFTPPKLKFHQGGAVGRALKIVYAADFTQAAAEADDLTTLGVPTTLQPYLPMAMTGLLLQGREVVRLNIEHVRRMLAQQGVQVQAGTTTSIGRSLLEVFRRVYVGAEKLRLAELDPPEFAFVR